MLVVTDQARKRRDHIQHRRRRPRRSAASPTPSTEEPIDATSQQPIAERPPACRRGPFTVAIPSFMPGLPPRSARGFVGWRGARFAKDSGGDRRGAARVLDRRLLGGDGDATGRDHRGNCRRLSQAGIPPRVSTSSPAAKPCSCLTRRRTCPWRVRPWRMTTEDAGPLEQEPVTDVHEQVVEADGVLTEQADEAAPAPDPAPVAPAPAPDGPDVATMPAENESQHAEEDAGPRAEGGQVRHARLGRGANADAQAKSRSDSSVAAPAPESPPAVEAVPVAEPTAAAQPAPAPTEPATTRVASYEAAGGAARRGRFRTVQPGESLWSIAADLLGDRATVPRIAREVNRLWELNDERIGTGRPDLLFAGTRLRLR